jgi:hypothetical protein
MLPWWIALVGGLSATILGKQMFGGIGHNLFNPALVGRAVVFVSWPGYFAAGYVKSAAIGIANTASHKAIQSAVDVVNGASPLAAMKMVYDPSTSPTGFIPQGLNGSSYYRPLLFANPWGCLGEVSALLLILGGRNKGLPFAQLARLLEERSRAGGLRMVYAIGEAAQEIAETLRGVGPSLPLRQEERLEDVFADLPRRARPGDVVLFSPACASFDRYRDYRERGRHFQELVEEYRRSLHG